jgi:hypothetical protein
MAMSSWVAGRENSFADGSTAGSCLERDKPTVDLFQFINICIIFETQSTFYGNDGFREQHCQKVPTRKHDPKLFNLQSLEIPPFSQDLLPIDRDLDLSGDAPAPNSIRAH